MLAVTFSNTNWPNRCYFTGQRYYSLHTPAILWNTSLALVPFQMLIHPNALRKLWNCVHHINIYVPLGRLILTRYDDGSHINQIQFPFSSSAARVWVYVRCVGPATTGMSISIWKTIITHFTGVENHLSYLSQQLNCFEYSLIHFISLDPVRPTATGPASSVARTLWPVKSAWNSSSQVNRTIHTCVTQRLFIALYWGGWSKSRHARKNAKLRLEICRMPCELHCVLWLWPNKYLS